MSKDYKIYNLREKTSEERAKLLETFRADLYQLRSKRVTGATAKNLAKIKVNYNQYSRKFMLLSGCQEGNCQMFDCYQL